MEAVYRYCGITRQGYFQALLRKKQQAKMMAEVESLVWSYRSGTDYRAGSRSLYYNLSIKDRYGIGVSKFEQLMSQYGLSLQVFKLRVITTRSCPRSKKYPNLTNGLKLDGINQLVVGDLTYLHLGTQRYYLFCLTDVYSGRIVGHKLSLRMRAQDAVEALAQWIRLRGKHNLKGCIHHTDGGSQYFSNLYMKRYRHLKIKISVARSCLENGYAEQRNNLLKNHLIPTLKRQGNYQELERALNRLLRRYDTYRKQEGNNWMSPVEFEKASICLAQPLQRELHDFTTAQ